MGTSPAVEVAMLQALPHTTSSEDLADRMHLINLGEHRQQPAQRAEEPHQGQEIRFITALTIRESGMG